MSILDEIIDKRKKTIKAERQDVPLSSLKYQAEELLRDGYVPVPFLKGNKSTGPFLIAEIKKKSPSKGIIRNDFDIISISEIYDRSDHVHAISVLTEPDYFSGSYDYIEKVKKITSKPVLMKDFIVDRYQVYRAFLLGASAFLMIAAVSDENLEAEISGLADELSMTILFETHSEEEYERALKRGYKIIGINNRNLNNFDTDINISVNILDKYGKPDRIKVISESGIQTNEHIQMLHGAGVDGFLIGERFMKSDDIDTAIEEVMGP